MGRKRISKSELSVVRWIERLVRYIIAHEKLDHSEQKKDLTLKGSLIIVSQPLIYKL